MQSMPDGVIADSGAAGNMGQIRTLALGSPEHRALVKVVARKRFGTDVTRLVNHALVSFRLTYLLRMAIMAAFPLVDFTPAEFQLAIWLSQLCWSYRLLGRDNDRYDDT